MVTPSWATKPSRIARDGYDLDEVDAELHLPLMLRRKPSGSPPRMV
jgi:hypothetical protein